MPDFKNEFTWSKTRSRNFSECRRRYWFNAYGKWPGWEGDAPARTQEIYILDKLKNRWMWAGEVVHDAVAEALRAIRAGGVVDPDALLKSVRPRMRREFGESRSKRYRFPGKAKSVCALREHEYDEEVPDEEWERIVSGVEGKVRNFLDSEIYADLRGVAPDDWLTIDAPKPSFFYLDGVKVWLKIDAAYRTADGAIRIIDWKPGASEDEWAPLQLAVYTLYAMSTWGASPDSIVATICNLSEPGAPCQDEKVSDDLLSAARRKVADDVQGMQSLLVSVKDNVAEEGRYDGADRPKACQGCNFLKECSVAIFQSGG